MSFGKTNGSTARESGCCMCADVFPTATPKPRAEGSNPSAPATNLAPKIGSKPRFLGAFFVFLVGGARSGFPLLMLDFGLYFRIWRHPFLLFPSAISSKEHQKNWRIRPSFPWKNSPLGGGGAGNSRRVRLPLVLPLLAYIWDKRALNSGDI